MALLALTLFLAPHRVEAKTYADPFAYCAAVGTVDVPDTLYTGEKVPLSIAKGLQKATGGSKVESYLGTSHWRCMDGKVYACTIGANLPCMEKANLSRTPLPSMVAYCRNSPGAEAIPMYIRDRASVYDWTCKGEEPVVTRQTNTPDKQGFISEIWYELGNP